MNKIPRVTFHIFAFVFFMIRFLSNIRFFLDPHVISLSAKIKELNITQKKLFNSIYFRNFYLIFLVLFATFIAIRFLFVESLRLDESQSMLQANRPFGEFLSSIARDIHMPLYGTILNIWISLFGNNIYTNRLISLGFNLISIPAIYVLTKLVSKKTSIGLYVATMFTVSPFVSWYGSELRMYSLFMLLSIFSHSFFLKIQKSNHIKPLIWISFGIFSFLGVYTHYFFLVFLFSQIVFFIFNPKTFPKNSRKYFIITCCFVIVSMFPWVGYVTFLNAASSQTPLLEKPSAVDLFNLYSNHLFGFQDDQLNTAILAMWPLVGVLSLFFLQKTKNFNTTGVYLGVMTFLPTFLIFSISLLVKPIFLSRYLIMCLPPLYLLIGVLLFSTRSMVLGIIRFSFIFLMIGGLVVQIINPNSPVKENYKGAINYVINYAQPKDIVATSAPFTIFPFDYYYNGRSDLVTVPAWDRKAGIPSYDAIKVHEQLTNMSEKYERLFIIMSYDQGFEKDIKSFLDTKYKLTETKNFSPKLNLYVYYLK